MSTDPATDTTAEVSALELLWESDFTASHRQGRCDGPRGLGRSDDADVLVPYRYRVVCGIDDDGTAFVRFPQKSEQPNGGPHRYFGAYVCCRGALVGARRVYRWTVLVPERFDVETRCPVRENRALLLIGVDDLSGLFVGQNLLGLRFDNNASLVFTRGLADGEVVLSTLPLRRPLRPRDRLHLQASVSFDDGSVSVSVVDDDGFVVARGAATASLAGAHDVVLASAGNSIADGEDAAVFVRLADVSVHRAYTPTKKPVSKAPRLKPQLLDDDERRRIAGTWPSRTFAVDDVKPSDVRFAPVTLVQAWANRGLRSFEAGGADAELILPTNRNTLIGAAHLAFKHHLPFVLTPDAVWLTLMRGLSEHVRLDPEAHRGFFVDGRPDEEIVVEAPMLRRGDPSSPWAEVFPLFSAALAERLGPERATRLRPRFSTSTPTDEVALDVALMDLMQHYVRYSVLTECGFPSITLEGTADDWRLIRARCSLFADVGLADFGASVGDVIDRIVAAAEGDIDRNFWRSFFKFESDSGADTVTGWVVNFFPYIMRNNQPLRSPFLKHVSNCAHIETIFPSSIARVPFLWRYAGVPIPMRIYAGLLSASQDPLTGALRPESGWAVAEHTPDP